MICISELSIWVSLIQIQANKTHTEYRNEAKGEKGKTNHPAPLSDTALPNPDLLMLLPLHTLLSQPVNQPSSHPAANLLTSGLGPTLQKDTHAGG